MNKNTKKDMVIVLLDGKVWSWKMNVSDAQDLNTTYFKDYDYNNHTFESHNGTTTELYAILDKYEAHPEGLAV